MRGVVWCVVRDAWCGVEIDAIDKKEVYMEQKSKRSAESSRMESIIMSSEMQNRVQNGNE